MPAEILLRTCVADIVDKPYPKAMVGLYTIVRALSGDPGFVAWITLTKIAGPHVANRPDAENALPQPFAV